MQKPLILLICCNVAPGNAVFGGAGGESFALNSSCVMLTPFGHHGIYPHPPASTTHFSDITSLRQRVCSCSRFFRYLYIVYEHASSGRGSSRLIALHRG